MGHPDENLLAAFAERTLAPAERGLVLEHLSQCADCRDVVFLAQQAAGEPKARRMSPVPLWARASAAGLLAASLMVGLLWVHRQAGRPGNQPTSQAQTRTVASEADGALRSKLPTARKPAVHARPRSIAPSAEAAGAEVAGSVLDQAGAAIPGAQISLRLGAATRRQTTTDSAGLFAIPSVPPGKYTAEFVAPGFQTTARDIDLHPQERAALSEVLAPGSMSQTVSVSEAAQAIQLQSANSAVQVSEAGASVDTQAITWSITDGVVQSCIGKACMTRPIPSPSLPVSIAFNRKIAIVVDAGGNLFRNAGAHWVAIKPQWPGKAIAVKLTLPNFALTNDQGQVWLSSDEGQTWHLP